MAQVHLFLLFLFITFMCFLRVSLNLFAPVQLHSFLILPRVKREAVLLPHFNNSPGFCLPLPIQHPFSQQSYSLAQSSLRFRLALSSQCSLALFICSAFPLQATPTLEGAWGAHRASIDSSQGMIDPIHPSTSSFVDTHPLLP